MGTEYATKCNAVKDLDMPEASSTKEDPDQLKSSILINPLATH